MCSGFVAVSISNEDARVYYVDQSWRDGVPIRLSQPDRRIVHDQAAGHRGRRLERACFYTRVIHALAGAVAILVISQADAAAGFLRYVEENDPGLMRRIMVAERLPPT